MITVYCDGGCLRNGKADPVSYGSYKVYQDEKLIHQVDRLPLDATTNNQAEYDILIQVLLWIKEECDDSSQEAVEIFSDSQLIVNQLISGWNCNDPCLDRRRAKAKLLLYDIGGATLTYVPRHVIVKELGH